MALFEPKEPAAKSSVILAELRTFTWFPYRESGTDSFLVHCISTKELTTKFESGKNASPNLSQDKMLSECILKRQSLSICKPDDTFLRLMAEEVNEKDSAQFTFYAEIDEAIYKEFSDFLYQPVLRFKGQFNFNAKHKKDFDIAVHLEDSRSKAFNGISVKKSRLFRNKKTFVEFKDFAVVLMWEDTTREKLSYYL